jgi:hypothetical protein
MEAEVQLQAKPKVHEFTLKQKEIMKQAEQNILMVDVECSKNEGDGSQVLAIGCVLISVCKKDVKILHIQSLVIDQPEVKSWDFSFWKKPEAISALAFFTKKAFRSTAKHTAAHFRATLDQLTTEVPNYCILVDDTYHDITTVDKFMNLHKFRGLHFDANNHYIPWVYVSRALTQSLLVPFNKDYLNLRCAGLYKAAKAIWNQKVVANKLCKPEMYDLENYLTQQALELEAEEKMDWGPRQQKHIPVWDCIQTLSVYLSCRFANAWSHEIPSEKKI